MKTKNLLISGIAGGITNFLLGWIFYGMLFMDFFPQPTEGPNTMLLIFLGCMTFGFLIAYIYLKWAKITTAATGAMAGLLLGLLIGLYFNFFNMAMNQEITGEMLALDVAITIVMTGIIGAVIGAVNGKLG